MALQYGANILASDMKNMLEHYDRQQSGVRTWRQLFGNASLGFQAQSDALRTDYSNIIAQAYKANLARENAILNAGLNQGSTQQMLSANRQDLHNTYQQYVQGYTNDANAIAKTYGEEVSAIDTALTQRSENFAKLYRSAYDYLSEELANATLLKDTNIISSMDDAVRYEQMESNYLDEKRLGWLRNDDGELKNWNEISHEILNPDGSLNRKGVEFFDQMFNATPQGYTNDEGEETRSFDQWLTEKSSDEKSELYGLRDWWIGQDLFNYTRAGTNKGTANVLSGRESDDEKASHYEYLSSADVKNFGNLSLNDISSKASASKTNYEKAYDSFINDPGVEGDYSASTKKAEAALETAKSDWANYQTEIVSRKSKYLKELKKTIGSERYDEFMKGEASFDNEYQRLLNDLKSSEMYDDKKAKAIETWYTKFVKRTQDFINKNLWTGKTSGY